MHLSVKEKRMKPLNATKFDRKPGADILGRKRSVVYTDEQ
jgi:hypothetical protein